MKKSQFSFVAFVVLVFIAFDFVDAGCEGSSDQYDLFYYAAEKGDLETVNTLIDSGLCIDRPNDDKRTALHIASWNGQEKIVEKLIEKGAQLEHKDDWDGSTPLHLAVYKGHQNIVRILIEAGANVKAKANYGDIPLHSASTNGFENIVRLLLQKGSDVNDQDNKENTPIHYAAYWGREKTVRVLLENGANTQLKNKEGKLPRYYALNGLLSASYPKIAELIDSWIPKRIIEQECARYSAENLTDSIIGGQPVNPGEFPWMAALGYLDTKTDQVVFRCGATIISDRFVLTAAHCVKENEPPFIVRMGAENLTDPQADNYYIKDIIPHPNYSSQNKSNDIALIRVVREIIFLPNRRPACLHTDTEDLDANTRLTMMGKGIANAERRSLPNELHKADVFTVPLSNCNQTYLEYNRNTQRPQLQNGISADQYCAHDPTNRTNSCWGDSGGPLQYFPANNSYIAHVVGVVGFNIACDTNYPTIHARVANYLNWIQPIVWPQPPKSDGNQ